MAEPIELLTDEQRTKLAEHADALVLLKAQPGDSLTTVLRDHLDHLDDARYDAAEATTYDI